MVGRLYYIILRRNIYWDIIPFFVDGLRIIEKLKQYKRYVNFY